jgi:hypothetical protein
LGFFERTSEKLMAVFKLVACWVFLQRTSCISDCQSDAADSEQSTNMGFQKVQGQRQEQGF